MTIAVAPYANVRVLSQTKGKSETIVAVVEGLGKANIREVAKEMKVSEEDRARDVDFEDVDIPSIDLSLVETDRAELVRQVGEAARQWGVCRLFNHGIPAELTKELEIHGLNFFGLCEEEKSRLLSRGSGASYYTGINTEEKRHSLHWAESFVMSLGQWTRLDLDAIKRVTIDWPTADDEFRNALLKYSLELKYTCEKLLQLAAESLELPSDIFSSPILGSGSITTRWNYYPACPLPADVLGAHSHTDPNVLTLIHQDKVGGLQVTKDGRWYNVKPVEGTLIMNISDALQIWSNGIFKSVLHRVLVNKDVPRISIAWILYTSSDQSLSAPNELVDHNHHRLYKDVTAKEYFEKVLEARKSSTDSEVFNGQKLIEALRI